MNQVVIKYCKTDNGYSGVCDFLEGFIVASEGYFDDFQKEVRASLTLYVKWAKEDGDEYPEVLDGDYELVFVECNED